MRPLTDRQRQCLDFIRRSVRERGFPPTIREIGVEMRVRSTNGVTDHLRALERKGFIKLDAHSRSRSILVSTEHICPECGCVSWSTPRNAVDPVPRGRLPVFDAELVEGAA